MIGKTLQDILSEKRISVGELSRKTGISDQTLYSIIRRDNMKVSLETLVKICSALNIDVERFYEQYLTENKLPCPMPQMFTPHQLEVLKAYVEHPELQHAVDRVLGVASETYELE